MTRDLDPSVEAFLRHINAKRHERRERTVCFDTFGAPHVATAGAQSLAIEIGASISKVTFLDVPQDLADELAAAINGVLARHAGYEPAAETSLVYRHAAE